MLVNLFVVVEGATFGRFAEFTDDVQVSLLAGFSSGQEFAPEVDAENIQH